MKPTIAEITNAVADAFNVRVDNITGPRRHAEYSHPRFIVYAIAHEAGYSWPIVGQRLGGRDHTTAMDGAKKVNTIAAKNIAYREKYERLRESLIGATIATRNWKFKSIRSAAQ